MLCTALVVHDRFTKQGLAKIKQVHVHCHTMFDYLQGVYQPGKPGILREFIWSGKVRELSQKSELVREIEFFVLQQTVKNICSETHVRVAQTTNWRTFFLTRTPRINPYCPIFELAQHHVGSDRTPHSY